MQTSRFGVASCRCRMQCERSRVGRCAIRCCRFACATSKKLDVDCENGKEGKRPATGRESEHVQGREKEAKGKSDDGSKATLREKLTESSLCTSLQRGWSRLALEMEKKKKVKEKKRREGKWTARDIFLIFQGERRNQKSDSGYSEYSYREYNITHVFGDLEISIFLSSRAFFLSLVSFFSLILF